jgi:hypothetical protein
MRKSGRPAAFRMLRNAEVMAVVGSVRIHGIVFRQWGARSPRGRCGKMYCSGSEPASFFQRSRMNSIDSLAFALSGIVRWRYSFFAPSLTITQPRSRSTSRRLRCRSSPHGCVQHDHHAMSSQEPLLLRKGHRIEPVVPLRRLRSVQRVVEAL